jgi:hypothetical protein
MNPEVCKTFATETKWESKLEELRSMQRKSSLWLSADARGAVPDLHYSPNASPAGRVTFVSGAKSFGHCTNQFNRPTRPQDCHDCCHH